MGHHIREFFRSARSASWATFSTFWVFLAVASYLLYSRQDLKYWWQHIFSMCFWIFMAVVYLGIVDAQTPGDPDAVDDWLDGYIVELILSMENIFLYEIILVSFRVPPKLSRKILFVTSFCQMFWQMWLFMFVASYLQDIKSLPYLLGAWLIYIGVASLREDDEDSFDPEHSDLFRMLRTGLGSRLMPHYPHDGSMFKRDESGKLCVTMLLPVTACIVVIMLVMEVDVTLAKIAACGPSQVLPNCAIDPPIGLSVCSRGVLQKNLAVRSGPWLGLTKHRSDDFWSALRTVAEADMANLQNLMIRLTDCDLRNIRQCATATLMTSQAEEVAEQTSGSQTRTTLLRPQQEGLKFADGTTTTTKVAVDAISMPPAATRPTVGPPDIPVKQVPKNKDPSAMVVAWAMLLLADDAIALLMSHLLQRAAQGESATSELAAAIVQVAYEVKEPPGVADKVVRSRHAVLHGDALSVDPHKAATALSEHCHPSTFVIIACAPLCPDFSQIQGVAAKGTKGPEGQKFVQWIHLCWRLFRSVRKLKFVVLVENVVVAKDTQAALDQLLRIKSFVRDTADETVPRAAIDRLGNGAVTQVEPSVGAYPIKCNVSKTTGQRISSLSVFDNPSAIIGGEAPASYEEKRRVARDVEQISQGPWYEEKPFPMFELKRMGSKLIEWREWVVNNVLLFVEELREDQDARTEKPGFAALQQLHRLIGSTLLASCGKERIEKLVTKTKVAGKLKIACSWVFGNVGKAMLKPLFARQHCGLNQPVSLSSSLQFALTDLLNLLPEIPLKPSEVRAFVLYAGVYVNISGSRCAAKQDPQNGAHEWNEPLCSYGKETIDSHFIAWTSSVLVAFALSDLYVIVSELFKQFYLMRTGISVLLLFFGGLLLVREEVQVSDTTEVAVMLTIVFGSVALSTMMQMGPKHGAAYDESEEEESETSKGSREVHTNAEATLYSQLDGKQVVKCAMTGRIQRAIAGQDLVVADQISCELFEISWEPSLGYRVNLLIGRPCHREIASMLVQTPVGK
ncbi:unnamed protein product [Symbiodinium microadriaticum]|nr:unnamed protein product [Symbiodinium microadriaticum]